MNTERCITCHRGVLYAFAVFLKRIYVTVYKKEEYLKTAGGLSTGLSRFIETLPVIFLMATALILKGKGKALKLY